MIREKEVVSHLLVTVAYFVLICLLRWDLGILGLLGMWGGALLGTFFLDIDHLVYWFVTHPEKEDSKLAKEVWERDGIRGIREIWEILQRYHYFHNRLVFHSAVGQAVSLILAFYLLTSGGSLFGSAFIMSINLHLLKDQWADFLRKRKTELSDWLFWQIKEVQVGKYLTFYLGVVSLLFLGLSWFLVRG